MAVVAPAIKSCSRISTLEFSSRLLPSQPPRFAKAVATGEPLGADPLDVAVDLSLESSSFSHHDAPGVTREGTARADLTVATADLTAVGITDAARLTKLRFDSSMHYPQIHLA